MSKQQKFVYTHTRPTNVCFNGVSFPVLGGDVIKCYPEFIEAFIPEGKYRPVPKGHPKDSQKPKFTFGHSPQFLRPDPTGGLPVRSVPGPRKTKGLTIMSPATVEEAPINPYDLGVEEEATIDIGTGFDTPTSPDPQPETLTTAPPAVRPEPKKVVAVVVVKDVEEEVEDVEEEVESVPERIPPGRAQLRKMRKDELAAEALSWGLELEEDVGRGVIFDALWKLFKYNEE